jgi:hypothetical protein
LHFAAVADALQAADFRVVITGRSEEADLVARVSAGKRESIRTTERPAGRISAC